MMFLFWIGIILLGIIGFKLLFPSDQSAHSTSAISPREIAQLRYERREISYDEYLTLIDNQKESKEKNK